MSVHLTEYRDGMTGLFDVGDGCWRRNALVTTLWGDNLWGDNLWGDNFVRFEILVYKKMF